MRSLGNVFGCTWSNQKRETSISEDIALRGLQKKKKIENGLYVYIICHWLSFGKLKQGNYTIPKRNIQLF